MLQARAVGLFGCLDLVDGNGAELQPLSGPTNPAAATAVGGSATATDIASAGFEANFEEAFQQSGAEIEIATFK